LRRTGSFVALLLRTTILIGSSLCSLTWVLLLVDESKEDGMKEEDNMMEKKNEMWGEGEEKRV